MFFRRCPSGGFDDRINMKATAPAKIIDFARHVFVNFVLIIFPDNSTAPEISIGTNVKTARTL